MGDVLVVRLRCIEPRLEPVVSVESAYETDLAFTRVAQALEYALLAVASWCPHGGDSTRIGDYHRADMVRHHLRLAQIELGVPNTGTEQK